MFREDNLAAAQIAQIFGSELLKVQNSARTDGGQTPQIVNMDPKQFLVGQTHYTAQQKEHERRITEALQREAEAAYPIAQSQSQSQSQPYASQVQPAILPPQLSSPVGVGTASVFDSFPVTEIRNEPWTGGSISVLEKIALSLERIANAVDKVDIKSKRKIVKRKPKYNKAVLLNETTS